MRTDYHRSGYPNCKRRLVRLYDIRTACKTMSVLNTHSSTVGVSQKLEIIF